MLKHEKLLGTPFLLDSQYQSFHHCHFYFHILFLIISLQQAMLHLGPLSCLSFIFIDSNINNENYLLKMFPFQRPMKEWRQLTVFYRMIRSNLWAFISILLILDSFFKGIQIIVEIMYFHLWSCLSDKPWFLAFPNHEKLKHWGQLFGYLYEIDASVSFTLVFVGWFLYMYIPIPWSKWDK